MMKLLKTKTTWAGAVMILTGIASALFIGDEFDFSLVRLIANPQIQGGLAVIFVRHAIAKGR